MAIARHRHLTVSIGPSTNGPAVCISATARPYVAACRAQHGWYDIYEADSGQWIYRGLGYWDVNSCFSFWDGGDVVYTSCSSLAQQSAPTYYATIGGTG